MANVVDARGFSCPEPVMMMRAAVKAGQFPVEVLVETVTSRENVRRAAEMLKLKVDVSETGEDEFKLVLTE